MVYTDKDRYSIGKYASCHGMAASVTAWKKTYPNLNESTVRGFKKRYKTKLKEASARMYHPKRSWLTRWVDTQLYLVKIFTHLCKSS